MNNEVNSFNQSNQNHSCHSPQDVENDELPKMFLLRINEHDGRPLKLPLQKELGEQKWVDFNPSFFKGKKILILIAGFLSTEETYKEPLRKMADKTIRSYNVIIGFVYNSGSLLQYDQARKNAHYSSTVLREQIFNQFCAHTQIDFLAHSMGVYLILNALNSEVTPEIENLYLMGGADDPDKLMGCFGENCTSYQQTINKVKSIFSFFSCRDDILQLHTLLFKESTLGHPTSWQESLSSKVAFINATELVKGHTYYWENEPIFKAIHTLSTICWSGKAFILEENGNLTNEKKLISLCPAKFGEWVGGK